VIRAVLFDLDGVLADTEPLQWMAYRRVLLGFGVDVGIEEYRRRWIATGHGPEYACRTYRLPITPEELRARKAREYRALLEGDVVARPGAAAALARLGATRRLGLVTNSVREEVELILGRLGMRAVFDATVAREDYARAKPAPDGYLAAAALLGVSPRECAVVEDTERGVRAGVAAGMQVIAVPNELTHDNDFTGCAHRLAHLDALTAEVLGDPPPPR
jgi:HAD superfamily hydrolase (TIGR01509 family)